RAEPGEGAVVVAEPPTHADTARVDRACRNEEELKAFEFGGSENRPGRFGHTEGAGLELPRLGHVPPVEVAVRTRDRQRYLEVPLCACESEEARSAGFPTHRDITGDAGRTGLANDFKHRLGKKLPSLSNRFFAEPG